MGLILLKCAIFLAAIQGQRLFHSKLPSVQYLRVEAIQGWGLFDSSVQYLRVPAIQGRCIFHSKLSSVQYLRVGYSRWRLIEEG